MRSMILAAGSVTLCVAAVSAQSTTGTISGRVVDTTEGVLPGVTVTASSPALQGVREAFTSDNGDYILTLLPSGAYTVTFNLGGFQQVQKTVTLAPTQVLPLDVTLGPAIQEETVIVRGRAADALLQTAQVATNFQQELVAALPTTRDIAGVMLMAPAVHPTGPSGSFSVAGSMSNESLFMVNGVTVNENIRGQANDLFIEDAIQETTVATAGVSAEFGRFGGGVVNVVSKSGGNQFLGSFRETFTNDNWRALVPAREGDRYAGDSKIDDVVPTHEYTLGGPVIRDRLWFFTAGRAQNAAENRQLVFTNAPYVYSDESQRYEGKVTYSLDANHRFQGAFTKINRKQLNSTFNTMSSMDSNSLFDTNVPQDLFTLNYTGVLGPSLFVEARYSQRNATTTGRGSTSRDLATGTLLIDSGRRYHAATFCGVCEPEQRDNQDIFVKGSYFVSTGDTGSHTVAFGYDLFNDKRNANNHQSGSDYRILNAPAIPDGTNLIATFVSGTSVIQWNPIFISSLGTNFRTHSLFVNDNWRLSDRLTANLGVRVDRNDGKDSNGQAVSDTTSISPRLGLVWNPRGDDRWSITASVAKYVAGLTNNIADIASPAGQPDEYRFVYRGPDINRDPATRVPNDVAVQRVFDWFFANGGATLPVTGTPFVRGVSPLILDSLKSQSVWEYASGVSRQVGAGVTLRADFVYRNYQDFYIQQTDTSTGKAVDQRPFAPAAVLGKAYDLTVIGNDDTGVLKRRYAGVTFQGQYRLGTRLDVGGNYTVSRAWGNVDGETVSGAGVAAGDSGRSAAFDFPEYRQESWNYPTGDLSVDQRHRSRLWVNLDVPGVPGLTVSALQALESGVPYSASNQNATSLNGIDPRPFVVNPGYLNPPDGSTTQYYYTARDAFRMEGQKRTDLSSTYTYRLGARSGRSSELFVQALVINVFNQFQLCGCGGGTTAGGTTFPLGGNIQNDTIDTTVRNNVSNPDLYQQFDPFTTTPVEGLHWAKSPTFGKALNRFAYTTPRTFRLTFGVRF
jgi:outer membrane receptor for ferrienterochelin and colicin